jgi:hypothetical protein
MLFRSLKRVSETSSNDSPTTIGATSTPPGGQQQYQQGSHFSRSPFYSTSSPNLSSRRNSTTSATSPRLSSSATSSKNLSNGFLIQKYEPGIRFPIKTFNGKIFLCTKDKDPQQSHNTLSSSVIHKLHYLGITQHQLIELSPLPRTVAVTGAGAAEGGTGEGEEGAGEDEVVLVQECHEMNGLKRVKFKRGEIITFEFHSGVLKRYFMFDSAECVSYVKQQMTNSGIQSTQISNKSKMSGASTNGSNVSGGVPMTTQSLLNYVKDLEYQFSLRPSHELVIQMVDILREAAECFGEADDERYQTIISYVQGFLQRDDVIQILDQQSPQRQPPPQGKQGPEPSLLPPVGQIPQSQIISDSPRESIDGNDASSRISETEDPQILLNLISSLQEHNNTPPAVASPTAAAAAVDPDEDHALMLPPLFLLGQLSDVVEVGGGEDDMSESDSDEDDQRNYLHLKPPHPPTSDSSSLALLWGEEGLQLFNETLHRIDEGESELGSILSDLDLELQEILGTPLGQRREEGGVRAKEETVVTPIPESEFIVTFEEFDHFLEELEGGGGDGREKISDRNPQEHR